MPAFDQVKFDGEGKENASYDPETGTITISEVTGSVNVTAETVDRYQIMVTFDKDNGEDDSKLATFAGIPIAPISNPAKQDSIYSYIFKGWYKVNKGGMEEEEFDFTDPDNYYDDFTVKAKWVQGSRQTYHAEATNANHLEFTTIDGKPLDYDRNVKAGLEYKFKMNAINNSSNPTPEYTVPNILTIKVGDDAGDLPLTADEYTIEANADRTSATVTISDKKTLYNIHISSDKGAVRQGTYNYEIAGLFGLEEIQGGTHDTSAGPLQLTFTPTGSYSSPKGENIYVYFDGIGEYVSPDEGYSYCEYKNNVLTIVDTYIVNSISIVARANDYELLNNLAWKQISSIGARGYAQYLFYIGEKKTVILYGNVHRVMIVDFYKDVEYTTQAPYCPMTFQFYDIVTKNSGSPYQTVWNNDGHEKGDNFNYSTSQLQNFLSNDIYKNLPNDTNADALLPYIKLVGKEAQISEDGGKTYIKRPFSAHLFNLSTGEYDKNWGWGEGIYSYYDIYKNDFQKSAVNGGVSQYWTRSQAGCAGIYYRGWVMRTDKKFFTDFKVINKNACAPGFCI